MAFVPIKPHSSSDKAVTLYHITLLQWFSTGDNVAPQGTVGNVWERFWDGDDRCWCLVGRGQGGSKDPTVDRAAPSHAKNDMGHNISRAKFQKTSSILTPCPSCIIIWYCSLCLPFAFIFYTLIDWKSNGNRDLRCVDHPYISSS